MNDRMFIFLIIIVLIISFFVTMTMERYFMNEFIIKKIKMIEIQQIDIRNRLDLDNYFIRETDIVHSGNLKSILKVARQK